MHSFEGSRLIEHQDPPLSQERSCEGLRDTSGSIQTQHPDSTPQSHQPAHHPPPGIPFHSSSPFTPDPSICSVLNRDRQGIFRSW
ncbi:MAG: hypothetical protein HC818_08440 [Synechococcaceae cyanobacterium RM1_1_27]|nr:hypothetical protein [Synechococcaceae cyanobacterium RM1_1_27]